MNNKNSKQSAASEPQCRGSYTSKGWIIGIIFFIITAGAAFIGMRHRYYAGDNSISVENEKGVAGLIDHPHDNFISEVHVGMVKIGDDNESASKKKQCRHVIPTDFCLAEPTYSIELPKDNLHFAHPAEGTTYANILHKIQQLQPKMKQHNAIYVVGHRYESQLKLDPHHSMSRAHCAGTYFIKEISKHGRTVDLSAAQAERYPSYTGIITALWDSFPSKVLSVITNHLRDVYNIVAANFAADGGFSSWLQRATIEDASAMEQKLGGLSVYALISLHLTTQSAEDDPRQFGGGGKKFGQLKSWHLNLLESSNQLHQKGKQSGDVHENWHSTMHSFVVEADKIVQDDVQGPFADALRKATGYPVTQLSFEHQRDSASWAPGLILFSTSFLNRKFHESARMILSKSFEIGEWEDLQQEKRDDVLDHFVNILCCEELLESIDAAAPVENIISNALEQCKPSDLDSMTELKPLLYDILHGVHNNHVNGHWFNPIKAVPKRTEGNGEYDTDQFNPEDREKARAVLEKEIRKLKKKADECTDERVVQYTRMVSCTCRPKCNANYILQQTNDHVPPIITGYMSRMLQRHPLS
jgi:hypothetical protein